jgi:F-type H+-transporting ATPase subunit a
MEQLLDVRHMEQACDVWRRKKIRNVVVTLFASIAVACVAQSKMAIAAQLDTVSSVLNGRMAGEVTASRNDEVAQEPKPEGLSQKPEEVGHLFRFPITNSMIVSWVVALWLVLFAQLATGSMKQVPQGAQNFLEWVVEGLYKFLESIVGPHLTERTFWFFATVFIFILSANWVGLLPGVGTIGWGHMGTHGFQVDQPLFRGANADVNMTLAMSLVFFACWIYWSLQEVGPLGILKELFAPKGESTGLMKWLMIVIFFAAGCLEIVSILFRPVSLTFRLYGNIFAGENMLDAMAKLVPGLGWLLPIPFYFLELLMGLVQALVFMLLGAVFTVLMCQHEGAIATGRS